MYNILMYVLHLINNDNNMNKNKKTTINLVFYSLKCGISEKKSSISSLGMFMTFTYFLI